MGRKFFIFAVFSTVIYNSLPTMATGPSSSVRIENEMINDYSTSRALRSLADMSFEKGINIIFNRVADSAQVAYGYQNSPQNTSIKASRAEALAAFVAQFDATLLASQITNSEAYSEISTARLAGYAGIQIFIDNIFGAIELCENAGGNSGELENHKNATLIAALNYNAVIYKALRHGNVNLYKTGAAIASNQEKSAVQFSIIIESIFSGINSLQIAVTQGSQDGSDGVFSAIESARYRASRACKVEIGIKFDFIHNFLVAFHIIQNEIGADFLEMQAIEAIALSDCDKEINGNNTSTENGSSTVSPEDEDQNGIDFDAISTAHAASNTGVQTAIALIFSLIDFEAANLGKKDQCTAEDEYSVSDTTTVEIYIAFEYAVDACFNATLLVEPEYLPVIRNAKQTAHDELIILVEGIQAAIELAKEPSSVDIATKLEAIEDVAIAASANVTASIFVGIKNNQSSQTELGDVIERAQERAVSLTIEIFRAVFVAIKIFQTQAHPEYEIEGIDCFSSTRAAQDAASSLFTQEVQAIFDAVESLAKASLKKKTKKTDHSCPCATKL